MIENILVNRYKGFTKVSGDLTFSDFINENYPGSFAKIEMMNKSKEKELGEGNKQRR